MTTLLLIRHGENDFLVHHKLPGHLPGIHLNARGLKQATEIENSLGKLPIKSVHSSPLERAVETIAPLSKTLGLEVLVHAGLTDLDVGEWAGRSWKVLRRTKKWKAIQENPSGFYFPGGESFLEAQLRVVKELDSIAAGQPEGLAVVIFHADPIKLAVAHYLGLSLDHFQRMSIAPGSVSIIDVNEGKGHLAALNLIPPFALPFNKQK